MKLRDGLPDTVIIGRRVYRLDLDFRNVLALMETLGREDLLPSAREYRALKCVMKRPPRDTGAALEKVKALLFPENRKQNEHKRITDFDQDADLIRAAFMQEYGINLFRDRLHWREFTCFLSGLPEGSRYCDILGIRARPMPTPTKYNAEERKWLAKAKAEYALQMTEKEQRDQYEKDVRNLAEIMIHWADIGGEEKNV